MNPMRHVHPLLILGAVALLSACSTTVNMVEPAQPVGQKQMVNDRRLITDASLARKVYVVGVNQAMTPGNLLRVQVEVYNRTRSPQNFYYGFEWFDADGMQVASTGQMIPCRIAGGERKMISSVAPRPGCADFRLKLIESK